jgi:hypothetical protein
MTTATCIPSCNFVALLSNDIRGPHDRFPWISSVVRKCQLDGIHASCWSRFVYMQLVVVYCSTLFHKEILVSAPASHNWLVVNALNRAFFLYMQSYIYQSNLHFKKRISNNQT